MYKEEEKKTYTFDVKITDRIYYSTDSYWGAYRFSTNENIPHLKYQDESDILFCEKTTDGFGTLAGNMQELTIGGKYKIVAETTSSKFGMQYKPINVFALAPKNEEDQLLFLKSVLSDYVAENLMKAYPNIVNQVMNGDIDNIDFNKVRGIGQKTWDKVKKKIIDNYIISDIIIMLKPLGVTHTMIKLLLSSEPNAALLKKKIEDNPYYLTEIKGLGFKKVDDFALKFNPKYIDSLYRLSSFIKYYLKELGDNDGDTYTSKYDLLKKIRENVPECEELLDNYLETSRMIYVSNNDMIGLKYYRDAERYIFNELCKKSKSELIFKFDEDIIMKAIEVSEEDQGFKYTDEQIDVIKNTLNNNVSIITGKAGTGKSTIMRAIVNTYKMSNLNISACALSAMASKRISETSGFEAMTIHRTLGADGHSFKYDESNKLPCDVIILDEGSMVGGELFLSLIKAIGNNTIVVMSGDHKQLPPIGFGNIFSDLISKMDQKCVNKLTKPMRQALRSGILVDANKVRENINPITETVEPKLVHGELKDMYYMFRTERENLTNIAIKTFLKSVEQDGINDVVIITPRRKDCKNSAFEINKIIQNKVISDKSNYIKYGDKIFYVGDKVMQMVNNSNLNVYNGYIGYITSIFSDFVKEDGKDIKKQFVKVRFNEKDIDGKNIEKIYSHSDIKELDLAYTITCHKMQGAGIKTVVGIIDNTHYTLLDNCMLYTMLTRAKKKMFITCRTFCV